VNLQIFSEYAIFLAAVFPVPVSPDTFTVRFKVLPPVFVTYLVLYGIRESICTITQARIAYGLFTVRLAHHLTFLRRGQGTLEMMIDEALSIKEHGWQVPSSSSSSSSMGTPPSSPEHTHTLVIHPNIEFFSSYQTSIFGDVLFNEEATIQQPLFPLPSLVAHHSKGIGEAFSHAFETLPNESQRGEKFRSLYPNPFVDLLT
jgi:hypothetical protein